MSFWATTALQFVNFTNYIQPGDADASAGLRRAILDADANGTGVYVPPGTWVLSRDALLDHAIELSGVTDLVLEGAGPATIFQLAGGSLGSLSMSVIQLVSNCSRVTLRNFSVDGNKSALSDLPATELYLVDVESGIDITLDNLFAFNCAIATNAADFSAAIKIGEQNGNCARITMRSCFAFDNDEDGFRIEDVDEFLQVQDSSSFDNVELGLRFIPRNTVGDVTDIICDNCFIAGDNLEDEVIDIVAGALGTNPIKRFILKNSIVFGLVEIRDIVGAIVSNSILRGAALASDDVITLTDISDEIIITDNAILGESSVTFGIVFRITGAEVADNIIIANNILQGRSAITLSAVSTQALSIHSNLMLPVAAGQPAVDLVPSNFVSTLDNTVISGNQMLGTWFYGVRTTPTANGAIGSLRIIGNTIEATAAGVFTNAGAAGYTTKPIIAHNRLTDNFAPLMVNGIGNLPDDCYVAGGNLGVIHGQTRYVGLGAPAFAANRGDTFQRVDGGAGTSFYVYEASWVAK